MALRLSTGTCTKMLNGGSTGGLAQALLHGIIDFYTGPQPLDADSAPTGTKVLRVTVGSGSWSAGSATNGLTFDATTDNTLTKAVAETWSGVGLANGVAGWGRFKGNASDADGTSTTLARVDFDVGQGSGVCSLSNTTIATGATETVNSCVFTLPKA